MTILEGFLQGAIQGATEFLPVSSSGHLSLFQHFFGLAGENSLFFTVMLHVGTLVAVFIAFFKPICAMIAEFFRMIGDVFKGRFKYSEANEDRKAVIMVIIALVPLVFLYFVKDWFTALSEDADIIVEGCCFMFTGTLLLLADKCVKGKKTAIDMTPRDALTIGVFQGIAALPGVSRSGSTIASGLLCGFSREFMVRFSFILGIPAVLASCVVEFKDAVEAGIEFETLPLVVGVITAAAVGLAAIKLINWLVTTDRFGVFAYYTLALGIIVIILGSIEYISGSTITESLSAIFSKGIR